MTSSSPSDKPIGQVEISLFDSSYYKDFDPSLARKLAGLTQQAYKQFHQRDNLGGWQIGEAYQLITSLGTQKVPFGFIASEANTSDIFVVFRGTIRFIEWFKDANVQLVSYRDSTVKDQEKKVLVKVNWEIAEGVTQEDKSSVNIPNIDDDFGYVTAGFRGIYISLRQQLIAALKQCPADSQIFVAGHSLGGALATLAIPDILKNTHLKGHQKIVLYTFASPRCGDKQFATSFQKMLVKHWRIANTEDFVTMLPFPTGNVIRPESPETPPEEELGFGGVNEVEKNPNPLFGFFKEIYDRRKRRMPDYVHTGTPVYFTIHESALERHHNLDEVYMTGISQPRL